MKGEIWVRREKFGGGMERRGASLVQREEKGRIYQLLEGGGGPEVCGAET